AGYLVAVVSEQARRRERDRDIIVRSFDQSPFSLCIFDPDLRYWRLNGTTTQVLSLSDDEARGLSHADVMPIDERVDAAFFTPARKVLRTGEPARTVSYARGTGESRQHAWAVSMWAVRGESGQIEALSSWNADVSAEYWARERLILLDEANG